MANITQRFPSENGVSSDERHTATRPFVIAQAPAAGGAPIKPSTVAAGFKAQQLEPFRFERADVTIHGVIDSKGASFLDEADVGTTASPNVRASLRQRPDDQVLGEIASAVTMGNRFIKDRRDQVKNVLIAPQLSSAFVLVDGEPVVLLQAQQGDVAGASMIHEMGHAIFDNFRRSRQDLALVLCQIFLGVAAGSALDRPSELARLPGIRMVSLPEWSSDPTIIDHPQGNVDEFWASSLTGFLVNPTGFKESVARATKADPGHVTKPGRDLLVFLASVLGQAIKSTGFSKPMLDLIAESNTPEAHALLVSVPNPGRIQRSSDPKDDLVRLLLAL
jgi:hypothetical protein